MWDHMSGWSMGMTGGWMPLALLVVLVLGIAIGYVVSRR